MTKRLRLVPVVVCLCLFGPGVPPAHSADVADKKTIIERARVAYVNLRRAGLVEFRATVQPNWNLAIKDQLQRDPAGAQTALSALNRLHFSMRLRDDQLDDTGAEYRLAFHAGTIDVQTTMSKDLVITRMDLRSKTFTSWVKPQLTKSSIGFVLSGYTASYQAAGTTDTMQVSVKLDYQVAGGLPLPHTLAVVGDQNGTLVPPAEFQLTDYEVTSK